MGKYTLYSKYVGLINPIPEVVIIESIILIPEALGLPSKTVHSIHNENKVLQKLGSHVFINGVIVQSELQGDVEHDYAIEGHPCGAVSLLKNTTSGKGLGTIKDT